MEKELEQQLEEIDAELEQIKDKDKLIIQTGGYFITYNNMIDKWLRIIGPHGFAIWSTMKRFCAGKERAVFPKVSQNDWSERIGIARSLFKASILEMEAGGIIHVIRPEGREKLYGMPYKYILEDLSELNPQDVAKKINEYRRSNSDKNTKQAKEIKPLSQENRFVDKIFDNSPSLFKQRTTKITSSNNTSDGVGPSPSIDWDPARRLTGTQPALKHSSSNNTVFKDNINPRGFTLSSTMDRHRLEGGLNPNQKNGNPDSIKHGSIKDKLKSALLPYPDAPPLNKKEKNTALLNERAESLNGINNNRVLEYGGLKAGLPIPEEANEVMENESISSLKEPAALYPPKDIKTILLEKRARVLALRKEESLKKKKEKAEYPVPQYAIPYMDSWLNLGLRSFRDRSNGVFRRSVETLKELINGTVFAHTDEYKKWSGNKVSLNDWQLSLSRFKRLIENPALWVGRDKTYLKRLSLEEFIFNPRTNKSMYLYCLLTDPEDTRFTLQEPWEKEAPGVTAAFINLYAKETGRQPSPQDRNHFIRAIGFILKQFKGRATLAELRGLNQKVRFFWETIKDGFDDPKRIMPYHLDSKQSFFAFSNRIEDGGYVWN